MSESRTGGVGCWPATSGRAGPVTDAGVLVADPLTAGGDGAGWVGVDVAVPVSDAPASVLVSVTGEVLAPPWGRGLAVAASRAPEHAAAITATNASVRT